MNQNHGLCECGCGQPAPLATMTRTGRGQVRGEPVSFISGHNGVRPLADRLWAKVDTNAAPDACWPWQGAHQPSGHGIIKIGKRAAGSRNSPTHRVVWELTNGPIPDGLFVCHRCDNPPCCNPAHLFLGTHQENMQDAVSKHRFPHGTAHRGARLTVVQVQTIRARAATGERVSDLAREFGVVHTAVSRIVNGTRWKHV